MNLFNTLILYILAGLALLIVGCDRDAESSEVDAGANGIPACGDGSRYHLGAGPYEPAVTNGIPVDTSNSLEFAGDVRFSGVENGIAQWEPEAPPFRIQADVLQVGEVYSVTHQYSLGDDDAWWTTSISYPDGDIVFIGAVGSLDRIQATAEESGLSISWQEECRYDGPAGCFTPNLHYGVVADQVEGVDGGQATAGQPATWTIGSRTYDVVLEGAVESQGQGRPCSGIPSSRGWLTVTIRP